MGAGWGGVGGGGVVNAKTPVIVGEGLMKSLT